MALMFAICRPQPNWMPRKPKLMFQICQKPSLGLSMGRLRGGILPQRVRASREQVARVRVAEAERARERAVAGLPADVEAARGIETVPLDQRHPQAGKRLAAPAAGAPLAVRTP